jgi:CheY-like chemotaxis protein
VRASAVGCSFTHLGADVVIVGSPSEALERVLPSESPSTPRKHGLTLQQTAREDLNSDQRPADGPTSPLQRLATAMGLGRKPSADSRSEVPSGAPVLTVGSGDEPSGEQPTKAGPSMKQLTSLEPSVQQPSRHPDERSSDSTPCPDGPTTPSRNEPSPLQRSFATCRSITSPQEATLTRSPRKSTQENKPLAEIVVINWDALGKESAAQMIGSLRERAAKPPPVLAVTCRLKDGAREEAIQAGCSEVLGWPLRELPIVTAVQKALGMDLTAKRRPSPLVKYLDGRKALVVDDNQINRKLAGRILEGQGCRVLFAESGADALVRVQEAHDAGEQFDFVLMDLQVRNGDPLLP